MRATPEPGGAWIDHVWFVDASSPGARAAQAALDERRRARRARVMELIAVRERWEAANPGEAWHGPGGDEH